MVALICTVGVGKTLQAKGFDSSIAPQDVRVVAQTLEQEAQQLYEAGRVAEAIQRLERAIADYKIQGDSLGIATALRNLALIHLKTGNLTEADTAITESLQQVQTLEENEEQTQLLAQIWDVQGQLQLAAGNAEGALEVWKQAADAYERVGDIEGITNSQINQAIAWQTLGLYAQAKDRLEALQERLEGQPDTALKAKALKHLGDVLRALGDLEGSQAVLAQSLTIAETLEDKSAIAPILLSSGNTTRARLQHKFDPTLFQTALNRYRQAVLSAPNPELRVQTQLNALSLLTDKPDLAEGLPDKQQLLLALTYNPQAEASNHPPGDFLGEVKTEDLVLALIRQIKPQIEQLPANRAGIYARINFAQTLLKIEELQPNLLDGVISQRQIAQFLATGIQEAKQLGDRRSEAYALGGLGKLYAQQQRWAEARKALEQGSAIAQSINATDIAYQWQGELGKILKQQGDREAAKAAYSQSLSALKSIRSDLAAVTSDAQFAFRESVEPIYREFVDLLLTPSPTTGEETQEDLQRARLALEALQLAELDNFFREACTETIPVQIDQVDAQTAVLYAAILEDRLEVILALPSDDGKPRLKSYTTSVKKKEVERAVFILGRFLGVDLFASHSSRSEIIEQTLETYENPSRGIVAVRAKDPDSANWESAAERLYNWLIRPAESDLNASGVQTLVFVLDGALRNIPMAALNDGEQYLIEKYSLALTPGLQLLDPKPLARSELRAIAAGLSKQSESHPNFPPIPNVDAELQQIQTAISSEELLNETFTKANFSKLAASSTAPIVHLATHGQFSSDAEKTFVLTWDETLNAKELKELLQADSRQKRPIELLVLSACETATGDERAALGLAGVAVRAGARSTMASLWKVSDRATSELMAHFYQEFNQGATKAQALQRAQLKLLQDENFEDPYFWAAFVLVGNWL
ncbi:CHAT domain-containing protein [Lusitaniella coriacea]|uniref:CHAT domain-containing protein n=1 Tax=Lusitaniella coriacea TaxID=1983105 RepID=UPI001D156353|nr:CHAT domain-containing protein [Lusitaniella coriacea]